MHTYSPTCHILFAFKCVLVVRRRQFAPQPNTRWIMSSAHSLLESLYAVIRILFTQLTTSRLYDCNHFLTHFFFFSLPRSLKYTLVHYPEAKSFTFYGDCYTDDWWEVYIVWLRRVCNDLADIRRKLWTYKACLYYTHERNALKRIPSKAKSTPPPVHRYYSLLS